MKLYHGTAAYNEEIILNNGLKKSPHKGIFCACCSLSFQEASFFALRKTPMSDLRKTGIVIEFEGNLKMGDYVIVESHGLLRDEQEIAVLNTEQLNPIALWRFQEDGWSRYLLPNKQR